MMWARLHPIRRRAALWLCPELGAPTPVLVVTARPVAMPMQPELERVMRLGAALLALGPGKTFRDVLGILPPAKGGHYLDPEYSRYYTAGHMYSRWVALKNNPPARMREKTYRELITFFAAHWPADLPWPSDIPRPARVQSEDAA